MPERTIKIVSFVWQKKDKDYNGNEITVNVDSRQGETVDLPSDVVRYGETFGAFVTPEDKAAEVEGAVEVADMDDEELVDWVSESTVPDIVNVAKNDPALVDRLLAAENTATGNDPRTSLVQGLAQVSGSGEAPPSSGDGGSAEGQEDDVDATASRLGVDLENVEGTGDGGLVTVGDVKDYYDEEMADATDSAIELAEEKDIYLADVTGTGKDGRIGKPDVEKYLSDQEEQASS